LAREVNTSSRKTATEVNILQDAPAVMTCEMAPARKTLGPLALGWRDARRENPRFPEGRLELT
jgi:hypothetical protein